MPLSSCAALVRHARQNGYAVAQINTNGGMYDLVRAVAEVAQEERAPVIIGEYEKNLAYRGYEYTGLLMRFFAERVDVPVALHLDHGATVRSCASAIDAGFNSVMIDGSHLPVHENI